MWKKLYDFAGLNPEISHTTTSSSANACLVYCSENGYIFSSFLSATSRCLCDYDGTYIESNVDANIGILVPQEIGYMAEGVVGNTYISPCYGELLPDGTLAPIRKNDENYPFSTYKENCMKNPHCVGFIWETGSNPWDSKICQCSGHQPGDQPGDLCGATFQTSPNSGYTTTGYLRSYFSNDAVYEFARTVSQSAECNGDCVHYTTDRYRKIVEAPDLSLNNLDCDGTNVSLSSRPVGCFYEDNVVYWNNAITTVKCSYERPCIERVVKSLTYKSVDIEYSFVGSGSNDDGLTPEECYEYAKVRPLPLTYSDCVISANMYSHVNVNSGSCSGGTLLLYEGDADNPGTHATKVNRCGKNCTELTYEGFFVDVNGKCECGLTSVSDCLNSFVLSNISTSSNSSTSTYYAKSAWVGDNYDAANRPHGCSIKDRLITYVTGDGNNQTCENDCVERVFLQNYGGNNISGCSKNLDGVIRYNTNPGVDCRQTIKLLNVTDVSNVNDLGSCVGASLDYFWLGTVRNITDHTKPHGCYTVENEIYFNSFFNQENPNVKIGCHQENANQANANSTLNYVCFTNMGTDQCIRKASSRKEVNEYLGFQSPYGQAIFDAECIDGYIDHRTGFCLSTGAMVRVELVLGEDNNEVKETVDCSIIDERNLICSQCGCFSDILTYGAWGSIVCETCVTGFGGEQCRDKCPTYDKVEITSSCNGEGTCNWGSQISNGERFFANAQCQCGDVGFNEARTIMRKYSKTYKTLYTEVSSIPDKKETQCSSDAEIERTTKDECYHYNTSDATCQTCEKGWTGKHCQYSCGAGCLAGGRCVHEPSDRESNDCDCSLNSAIGSLLWGEGCCPAGFIVSDPASFKFEQEDPPYVGPYEVLNGENSQTVSIVMCEKQWEKDIHRGHAVKEERNDRRPYGCYRDNSRNYYFNSINNNVECGGISICISQSFFSLDDINIFPYNASLYKSTTGGFVDRFSIRANDAARYCTRCPGVTNDQWLTGSTLNICGGSDNRGKCEVKSKGVTMCTCKKSANWEGPYCRCDKALKTPFQDELKDYGCSSVDGDIGTCLTEPDLVNGTLVYCGPPEGYYIDGNAALIKAEEGHYVPNGKTEGVTAIIVYGEATPCPAGKYQPNRGQLECIACDEGDYQDETGQIKCKGCAIGKTTSNTGEIICQGCAVGKVSDTYGSDDCTACDLGMYQDELAQQKCKDCPIGRYTNVEETVECKECPFGKYQDEEKQEKCTACAIGKYQNIGGKTECKNCAVGRYQNTEGSTTTCTVCGGGKYQNAEGKTECKSCVAGKFALTGKDFCEGCGNGQYQLYEGQSECTKCEKGRAYERPSLYDANTDCESCGAGKFTEDDGSTTCEVCAAGRHWNEIKINGIVVDVECVDCTPGKYSVAGWLNQYCVACGNTQFSVRGATECTDTCSGPPIVGFNSPCTAKTCATADSSITAMDGSKGTCIKNDQNVDSHRGPCTFWNSLRTYKKCRAEACENELYTLTTCVHGFCCGINCIVPDAPCGCLEYSNCAFLFFGCTVNEVSHGCGHGVLELLNCPATDWNNEGEDINIWRNSMCEDPACGVESLNYYAACPT